MKAFLIIKNNEIKNQNLLFIGEEDFEEDFKKTIVPRIFGTIAFLKTVSEPSSPLKKRFWFLISKNNHSNFDCFKILPIWWNR